MTKSDQKKEEKAVSENKDPKSELGGKKEDIKKEENIEDKLKTVEEKITQNDG